MAAVQQHLPQLAVRRSWTAEGGTVAGHAIYAASIQPADGAWLCMIIARLIDGQGPKHE